MCDNDVWWNQDDDKSFSKNYSRFSFDEWYYEPESNSYDYQQHKKEDSYKVNGHILMSYSRDEIAYCIERHKIWLNNRSSRDGRQLELHYADLRGFDFQNTDLRYSRFSECALDNCILSGADFSGASFYKSSIKNVKALNANFKYSSVYGSDFYGSKLTVEQFVGVEVTAAKNLILA